jgi:hypothetical protein
MEVFSNRDTSAVDEGGDIDAAIAGAAPSQQFIYVPVPSVDESLQICSREVTGCRVMTIGGAARSAVGTPVLVLTSFARNAPITEVDAAIGQAPSATGPGSGFRAQLGTHPVHVLDGAQYTNFDPNSLFVYASGFADSNEASATCTELGLAGCQIVQLAPV